MDNVIAFAPRQRPPEPEPPVGLNLRASFEEAAQTALDAADKIIAALDRINDDASEVAGASRDPRLDAMAARAGQVIQLREPATPAAAPEAPASIEAPEAEATPTILRAPRPLPWGGAGNVIAAAGVALFEFVGG